jgi:hypothetical protein
MTKERRGEVNQRLAEFQWPGSDNRDQRLTYAIGHRYTADLNALAWLEVKLPRHGWNFGYDPKDVPPYIVSCCFDDFETTTEESTEAEARAEAICRYLEGK